MEPRRLGVGGRPPRGEDAREARRNAPEELPAVHRSAAMLKDSKVFHFNAVKFFASLMDYFILANTTSKFRPSTAW